LNVLIYDLSSQSRITRFDRADGLVDRHLDARSKAQDFLFQVLNFPL
jgi:hypothetical protein